MVDIDYSKYLNKDNTLNKGKLWNDIASIRGFFSDERRNDLYEAVNKWYNTLYKEKEGNRNASA